MDSRNPKSLQPPNSSSVSIFSVHVLYFRSNTRQLSASAGQKAQSGKQSFDYIVMNTLWTNYIVDLFRHTFEKTFSQTFLLILFKSGNTIHVMKHLNCRMRHFQDPHLLFDF